MINFRETELDPGIKYGISTSPWIPPGISPLNIHNKPFATPLTGTRRNQAVEHSHVFLANPSLSPVDPDNFCWIYGMYDYKAQIPYETALGAVQRMIDLLIERVNSFNPPSSPAASSSSSPFYSCPSKSTSDGTGGVNKVTSVTPLPFLHSSHYSSLSEEGKKAASTSLVVQGENKRHEAYLSAGLPSDRLPSPQALAFPGYNNTPGKANFSVQPFVKSHLIIDIIATRKHTGPVPTIGLPYRLGQEIYKYVDLKYSNIIITTFVGLTDNTARRPGRDMYYFASDDLSRTQLDFSFTHSQHMFIVFPEICALHGNFPESMVSIRKRQQKAEEEAARIAELERIRYEQELAAARPIFMVRHLEEEPN